MAGKIAVALVFAAAVLIMLYACLVAAGGSEAERYRDDWAQQEWIREWNRRKEDKDGPDPED